MTQKYIYQTPPNFNEALHYIDGVVIKHRNGNTIAGHLTKVGLVAESLVPGLQVFSLGLQAVNLGVSVATFVHMRHNFKRVHEAFGVLQHQRQNDLNAELMAVLDALALSCDGHDGREWLRYNFVPTRSVIRRYRNYIDEQRTTLPAYSSHQVDLIDAAFLLAATEVKVGLLLGEHALAEASAEAHRDYAVSSVCTLANAWTTDLLYEAKDQDELAITLDELQRATGQQPLETLSRAWMEARKMAQAGNSQPRISLAWPFGAKKVKEESASLDDLHQLSRQRALANGLLLEARLSSRAPSLLKALTRSSPSVFTEERKLIVAADVSQRHHDSTAWTWVKCLIWVGVRLWQRPLWGADRPRLSNEPRHVAPRPTPPPAGS